MANDERIEMPAAMAMGRKNKRPVVYSAVG
jgi:hypothetical protein